MSDMFDHYPLSSRITFFPANIADIREVFEHFPQLWQSLPGLARYRRLDRHPVFHKVLDRPTSPPEWQEILLPQNYDTRFLFIDVDLDGWSAAISVHDNSAHELGWMARGLLTKLLERDGYQRLEQLPLLSIISVAYDFEPRMLTSPVTMHNASLTLEVASSRVKFDWSTNRTYDPKVPWYIYDCWAEGRDPYKGLDLPVVETLGDTVEEIHPSYLRPRRRELRAFGFYPQRLYEPWDQEMERDYLSVLPFDATGHERVNDFFNTKIIAQWLRDNHGIDWDAPSFYEGDSLLYVVGDPDGIDDPFTPRIPVETYYRFQGIDMQRNRTLLTRGQF